MTEQDMKRREVTISLGDAAMLFQAATQLDAIKALLAENQYVDNNTLRTILGVPKVG